jgi:hypothetical protein
MSAAAEKLAATSKRFLPTLERRGLSQLIAQQANRKCAIKYLTWCAMRSPSHLGTAVTFHNRCYDTNIETSTLSTKSENLCLFHRTQDDG